MHHATHPDYLAHLAGIRAEPADDLRRLVLADWLDENGEPERAEFIRVQVELAKWSCDFKQTPEQPGWEHDCGTDRGYWLCQPLRSRERELLSFDWVEKVLGTSRRIEVETNSIQLLNGDGRFADFLFRRGFVAEVRLPLTAFLGGPCERCNGGRTWVNMPVGCKTCSGTGRTEGLARAIFSAHPVTKVVLTDRQPEQARVVFPNGGPPFGWSHYDIGLAAEPSELPTDFWQAVPGGEIRGGWKEYPTAAEANAALSAACVSYGRELAGLPNLYGTIARVCGVDPDEPPVTRERFEQVMRERFEQMMRETIEG